MTTTVTNESEERAAPVPSSEALRQALMSIEAFAGSTMRTRSRDIDDWFDDVETIAAVARKALATLPVSPAPAEAAGDMAHRIEVTAAWNDLPAELRCHPGLKRLYRAAISTPAQPAATDEELEHIAMTVRPISETGEPSWEHACMRAYERARGITGPAQPAAGEAMSDEQVVALAVSAGFVWCPPEEIIDGENEDGFDGGFMCDIDHVRILLAAAPQPAQVAEPVRQAVDGEHLDRPEFLRWFEAEDFQPNMSAVERGVARAWARHGWKAARRGATQQAQGSEPAATPATPQQMAQVDAALDLRGLPPIRMAGHLIDALMAQASAKGIILQAHVREILRVAAQGSESGEAVGHDGKKWPETFDGQVWAKAFMLRWPLGGYDEGDLIAWFANAIMRGYDERAWRGAANDQRDAARWRKFRALHWSASSLCAIVGVKGNAKLLGMDCPHGERLDAALDAIESDRTAQAPGGAA